LGDYGTQDEERLFEEAGVVDGVATLLHSETIVTEAGLDDNTINNRLTEFAVNRTHKRMVYAHSGKLLENFEDPIQMLVAFRDAIKGEFHLTLNRR
jgi:hypothetical protein